MRENVGVTRIISGRCGSLPLATPGSTTRPTSERVREAVFSSLEAAGGVADARVADLYAGSGALGLEALSRGAAGAVLVESNRAAAAVCRRNAATVGRALGTSPARVAAMPVRRWLGRDASAFDLVFLDPPYALAEDQLTADLAQLVPRLATGATVVVERSTRSPEPAWPDGLERRSQRKYGETTVWTAAPVDAPGASGAPAPIQDPAPARSGR